MTYREQLKSPLWQRKRLEIIKRDEYKCTSCNSSDKKLHVHHNIYFNGKMAWEYENRHLYTLCDVCHKRQHEIIDELKIELSVFSPLALQHFLNLVKSTKYKASLSRNYDNGDLLCYTDWIVDELRETAYKQENDEINNIYKFYY